MWSFSVWSVRFRGWFILDFQLWLWLRLWLCRHRFIWFLGCFFFLTERWKSSDKNEWRHLNVTNSIQIRKLHFDIWALKTEGKKKPSLTLFQLIIIAVRLLLCVSVSKGKFSFPTHFSFYFRCRNEISRQVSTTKNNDIHQTTVLISKIKDQNLNSWSAKYYY